MIIFGFLFILNVLAWSAVFDSNGTGTFKVSFFDVGQGDSIFIETPKKHQILIDGGPGSAVLEKLANEMPFWDRTIDLIILTHPEKDHLAGLLEVLKSYKVENILWTGIVRDTAEWELWQKQISEEGASIKIARAGQRVSADKATLEILFPFESLEGLEFKDSNNTSIVSRLVLKENSFLFTGDIHESAEKKLLASVINLDTDVLKVSHHGSKTSTSEEFIEKISPEIAVISLAKNNPYGHPAKETLNRLKDIKILRTDLLGDIDFFCDLEKCIVQSD